MQVTIGIPFFNSENTLPDTLRSIYAQTFTDWELLLVDDGSRDGSLALAQAVAAADPRVRVISDGQNRKLPYRRNQIARLAQGTYLAHLDADDLMHPCRLEKQVAYLQAHPAIQALGAAAYSIDGENRLTGVRHRFPLINRPAFVLEYGLFIMGTLMTWTAWARENPFDETFARSQDHELWCRTYRSPVFAKLEEPLVFLRESYRNPQAYLRLYLLNGEFDRKLYRIYGSGMVSRARLHWLIAKSYLKGAAYRGATLFGWQAWLVRQRNHRLTPQEQAAAASLIECILRTPVPGLSPVLA